MGKNNNNIIPVVTYYNANKYKSFKDNKSKSGISRLNNLVTGKKKRKFLRSIGSAKCLSGRLIIYYSSTSLRKRLERGSSIIHRALLKYGYSNFSLDIFEYCERYKLITFA